MSRCDLVASRVDDTGGAGRVKLRAQAGDGTRTPTPLTVDPDILSRFTDAPRPRKLAIVVETAELYGHCAKALRRGGVWDSSTCGNSSDAPDLAEIYACQFAGIAEHEMRSTLHGLYSEDLDKD